MNNTKLLLLLRIVLAIALLKEGYFCFVWFTKYIHHSNDPFAIVTLILLLISFVKCTVYLVCLYLTKRLNQAIIRKMMGIIFFLFLIGLPNALHGPFFSQLSLLAQFIASLILWTLHSRLKAN